MFDFLPENLQASTRTNPQLLAMRFLSSSGARLVRAAARIGDEAGAALAHALADMIVDPTVDPMHWPIDEMLALLRGSDVQPDAQVDRLIANLSHLRSRIDAGSG